MIQWLLYPYLCRGQNIANFATKRYGHPPIDRAQCTIGESWILYIYIHYIPWCFVKFPKSAPKSGLSIQKSWVMTGIWRYLEYPMVETSTLGLPQVPCDPTLVHGRSGPRGCRRSGAVGPWLQRSRGHTTRRREIPWKLSWENHPWIVST